MEHAQLTEPEWALGHWLDLNTIAWPAELAPNGGQGHSWELWTAPDGGLTLVDGEMTASSAVKLADLREDSDGLTVEHLYSRGHLRGFRALKLAVGRELVEESLKGQLAVVQRSSGGAVEVITALQIPGVLDDLYAAQASRHLLGPTFTNAVPSLRLWAPTARHVDLLLFGKTAELGRPERLPMSPAEGGVWLIEGTPEWTDRAYQFEVAVYVPSLGRVVTNVVTDPYSVGLALNSTHSVLVDLTDPRWSPDVWAEHASPAIERPVDRAIYELHIRDFSVSDETVPAELRGTYEAFALQGTDGVAALAELAGAGINTVHLLPSFDIATIEEDRSRQIHPRVPEAGAASTKQQAAVSAVTAGGAFNWGYDPLHYSSPEGSYASAANQHGGRRSRAFREMVGGLHRLGLQVVLDKVFNHTDQSGQGERSVLDKVVPGYYHRLCHRGMVEKSTCCENVATEHVMAGKLMVDAVVTWARHYRVDGFRFDLMGHHTRANMEAIRAALDALRPADDGVDGRLVYLYGEGWNFGEVAHNARFRQAVQGQLGGTGIGAFNDRLRDAVVGGAPFDTDKLEKQGFATGLYTNPNGASALSRPAQLRELRHLQDLVRVSLAGCLADFEFETSAGVLQKGAQIDYEGAPAGYASEPSETVNYVDAHDNETLYDVAVWKLPADTSMADRVRVNTLALATVALGQAPSFWHAGTEMLRSKSMDRDSYNSGDHFNRLDWTMRANNFGVGLPPAGRNLEYWDAMRPFLADSANKPGPADIAEAHARALDLLRLRSAHPLLRLGSAEAICRQVSFPNAGPGQTPGLVLMRIDGDEEVLLVAFNAAPAPIVERVDGMVGLNLSLSPVLARGADPVLAATTWDAATATLSVPARSAVVLVAALEP